jgi:hypothetical protein
MCVSKIILLDKLVRRQGSDFKKIFLDDFSLSKMTHKRRFNTKYNHWV